MKVKTEDDMFAVPETLYELCEEVCHSIEAQPLNYDQGHFAISADGVAIARGYKRGEACGTAFCRAGWMCAIIDQGNGIKRTPDEWKSVDISGRAQRLLWKAGIPEMDTDRLFDGDGGTALFKYGTPDYVKAGIAGMRAFMAKHEAKLKATKIPEEA